MCLRNLVDPKLPKTAEEAYALDVKNCNTMWADVISKEKENVRVAFKSYQMGS